MNIELPRALRDRLEEPAAEALSGLLGAVMIEVEGRVRDVFSERLEARIGLAESRMEARWLAMREQVGQCATKGDLAALEAKLTIRISDLGSRLDGLEARVDRLEGRMDALDARMNRLEARMDRLEARMDALEARMAELECRLEAIVDARIQRAENRLVRWMFGFFVTQVGITLAAILTAAAILT